MGSDDPIEKRPRGIAGSPGGPEDGALYCDEWESLAAEALDGSLGAVESAAFEQHRRQCPSCAQAWEQCGRGAEWLRFLDDRPQPPLGLVDAILAATSGALVSGSVAAPEAQHLFRRGNPSASRGGNAPGLMSPTMGSSALSAPGLFMTAAMAFFSLALTVSLFSAAPHTPAAHPNSADRPLFRRLVSSFSPSSIGLMATQQYYSLQERGAKFYDNLPLVRELEAETRALSFSDSAQSEGDIAPEPHDASPRSRNRGAGPLPRGFQGDELAGAWTDASRLQPVKQLASSLESHRLAEPDRLYWSRA